MRTVIYLEEFVKKVYKKLTNEGYESDEDDRPSFNILLEQRKIINLKLHSAI